MVRDNSDEKFHPAHGVINEEMADRARTRLYSAGPVRSRKNLIN